ncbi:hypothetical protein IC582_025724 [Cucumis melo]
MALILGLMEEIHNNPPCLIASLLLTLFLTSGSSKTQRLDCVTSNHFPLALIFENYDWGPCPFRFKNLLLQVKFVAPSQRL